MRRAPRKPRLPVLWKPSGWIKLINMPNETISNKIEQTNTVSPIESSKVSEKISESEIDKLKAEKNKEQASLIDKQRQEVLIPKTNSIVNDDYHLIREKEIDSCLSEGLEETFLAMSPQTQKRFKEEGEATAAKINILLDAARINIGKIINLIRRWLGLITGVNRYFIDQEAKIKADKIIKIKNKL